MKTSLSLLLLIFLSATLLFSQEPSQRDLPTPDVAGGMPLMKALLKRETTREFSPVKLTDQKLANLLWAADGINRPDSKKRTAPSAMNYQEIEIYISTADGLFLYDANLHSLIQLSAKDIRSKTGIQDFVKEAPINLIFVADFSKMTKSKEKEKELYAMADAAFISENVYLFCASEGLATGVRANIDKEALAREMNLRTDQHVILAQSVGYFKTK